MFTDMERKQYPEHYVRLNSNFTQDSAMTNYSRIKNPKHREPSPSSIPAPARLILVGATAPSSKIVTVSKQNSAKHETLDLKSNVVLGSSRLLTSESGYSGKHQNQKQARIMATKTKRRGQVQRPSDVVEEPLIKQPRAVPEPKAAKKPATPKTGTSKKCENAELNKSEKQQSQLMPRHTLESKMDYVVRAVTPPVYSEKSKISNTLTPATRDELSDRVHGAGTDTRSNLHEIIAANTACLDELDYKRYYYQIQQLVEKAIKNHKIFLIRGDIPYLEQSMKKRGWVQKYESTKTRMVPYGSVASLDTPSLGSIHLPGGTLNEKALIFQFLRHVPPDFIWDCRNEFIDWNSNIKQSTLLNRFQKSFLYTSKLGMATILEEAHWNYEEKVSAVQCPRSYNVSRDRNAFIEDYRMTAAVGLLKWFVEQIQKGVELAVCGSSPISLQQIEFAIKRCEQFVALANNENLDNPETLVSAQEWDLFIEEYMKAVHQENGFIETTSGPPFPEIEMLYASANAILKKVKDVDPQFELNGYRNIWILKPSDLCCGTGIVMTHKLNHIMKKVHDNPKDYFVVQKYIEKPLLVQDTKFDVRQWYLVTKSYPLTIWIYKESLLRFSSRPFSFACTYHEAVHICNTAVQCKYNEQRNSVRAKDWDCEKINDYLKKSGYKGEPWYEEIYPKMCEAIIATMLAAQQHMDKRRCSFELYGADFMIMNDLSVWLIEINTNPRMHPPSTRVTERLYPDVMESLIKVILDYPVNPKADTGNFVLAYQQDVTTFQPYFGASMFVLGKAMNPKPKNLRDRDDCNSSWTPPVREKHNGTAILLPGNQKIMSHLRNPNISHLYNR